MENIVAIGHMLRIALKQVLGGMSITHLKEPGIREPIIRP
jgi:hypothetical protein